MTFAHATLTGRFHKDRMTQEELAQKIGVSRQTVSGYERGTMPRLDDAMKISKLLGFSLDSLSLPIK